MTQIDYCLRHHIYHYIFSPTTLLQNAFHPVDFIAFCKIQSSLAAIIFSELLKESKT